MGEPQVPIDVDDATGMWNVDGIAMILVPRHFFVNNHTAIESALGEPRYAQQLFEAGHKSAYAWCEKEARTHGLEGIAVFHHCMKRLSQHGWFPGALEFADALSGKRWKLASSEIHCAAEGRHDHCVFETLPVSGG